MKTNFCLLCLIVLFCFASTPSAAQPARVLTTGLPHPESIISDGTSLYVSCVGSKLEPLAKDGDGSIAKLAMDGTIVSQHFNASILNAPKGMAILQQTLYVTDIDRLLGFDLSTGREVVSIDFSSLGVTFLNDLTAKNDRVLFATATDLGKVFQLTFGDTLHMDTLAIPLIIGANGICYDSLTDRLYIAGMGSFSAATGEGVIGYIDWKNGRPAYHEIKGTRGFFDGLVVPDSGHLLLTDWVSLSRQEGLIKKVNIKTGAATIITKERIGGPADFYYDRSAKRLLVPAMQTGSILSISLAAH